MKSDLVKLSKNNPASRAKKNTPLLDARSVALSVLKQVIYGSMDTQEALDRALQASHLSLSDKKLATELVYGTVRQKIRLDWFLKPFLTKPEKLPVEIILGLEMALYEFFFLRIPAHASFDMAVSGIKRKFGHKMSGLVNAVLRSAQRNAEKFSCDTFYEEKKEISDQDFLLIDAFSRKCSMPLWIGRLWENSYGKDRAFAYLAASAQNAPIGVRLNSEAVTQLQSSEGSLADSETYILQVNNHAYAFEGALPQDVSEQIEKGFAVRQSVASYEVLYALQPEKWAMPVWDCCAGRGGKTMALIEAGYEVALVSDISSRRLKGFLQEQPEALHKDLCVISGSAIDIAETIGSEQKAENTVEHNLEHSFAKAKLKQLAGSIKDLPQQFGTVLVDAPCSGFGTLSRHPEIRLRRNEEDIKKLAQTQYKILCSALKKVRAGGNLVYITCTLTPEENEEQVASFLQEHPFLEIERSFTTPHDSPLKEFFYGVCFKVPMENT